MFQSLNPLPVLLCLDTLINWQTDGLEVRYSNSKNILYQKRHLAIFNFRWYEQKAANTCSCYNCMLWYIINMEGLVTHGNDPQGSLTPEGKKPRVSISQPGMGSFCKPHCLPCVTSCKNSSIILCIIYSTYMAVNVLY